MCLEGLSTMKASSGRGRTKFSTIPSLQAEGGQAEASRDRQGRECLALVHFPHRGQSKVFLGATWLEATKGIA